LSVGWREKECIGNVAGKEWDIAFRWMSEETAAVNGHCSELADRGFLMLEQQFPKCVPWIPMDPRPIPRG